MWGHVHVSVGGGARRVLTGSKRRKTSSASSSLPGQHAAADDEDDEKEKEGESGDDCSNDDILLRQAGRQGIWTTHTHTWEYSHCKWAHAHTHYSSHCERTHTHTHYSSLNEYEHTHTHAHTLTFPQVASVAGVVDCTLAPAQLVHTRASVHAEALVGTNIWWKTWHVTSYCIRKIFPTASVWLLSHLYHVPYFVDTTPSGCRRVHAVLNDIINSATRRASVRLRA